MNVGIVVVIVRYYYSLGGVRWLRTSGVSKCAKVNVATRAGCALPAGRNTRRFHDYVPVCLSETTNGDAAKVMGFDRLGKKVRPGTFGNIRVG